MMSQKPLHQLLQEDQEPFLLKNYIADRRCQLKKPSPKSHLQIKKRKPISDSSNFPHNFCRNACFFSVNNSPDLRKSPLFEFQSPSKSPCKTPNAIFLHIPTKTAALLLEAALRIQKQSSSPKDKNHTGFGLFGSLIKRITQRNRTRKREISGDGVKAASVKDMKRWDSSLPRINLSNERENKRGQAIKANVHEKSACDQMGFACSCNGGPTSAVWSESNEEKSWDLDLEASSSSQSDAEDEDCVGNFEFINKLIVDVDGNTDFASYENHFCESPFHFVLRRSPSSGHRTPVFSSPATSPSRYKTEGKQSNDVESLKKFQAHQEKNEEEEEEDKEQCSPVSVLDPPFEDDDDGHDDQSEDDGFDLECSYAIVQRAKQQLLQKLRRFEKLAELDPVELEKIMLEQEEEEEGDDHNGDVNDIEEEMKGEEMDSLIIEELSKTSFCRVRKIPRDMKRLVSDLIKEEETEQEHHVEDREAMVKRVCKRFESWKEVESNTIDMMVEQDFKRREEANGWKNYKQQVKETTLEIELGIFGLLVDELSEELVGLTGI
ncbi:uncharacterized protein LOC110607639 [Manihot esculenta]|uniref:Uncharacterized protein n=1 Tax=Manihot esculenta TaxID=3983 RepID=A0ACB7H2Z8_MANES|nr:uncharacterized protein LOC110607639 [Manihot esculenta]KAG8647087.1 hypothetical protein MANES_09G058764v8 [Manihot esculenta]